MTLRSESPALDLRGISKAFYGVKANDDVDFELRQGEVHALLGENGAGKSTLCSIIAGLYRPDTGTMHVYGEPAHFRSPKDAFAAGIGMVYQHFRLVNNLTVAENMVLGNADLRMRYSDVDIERQTHEIGNRYGLPVDPQARIWQLSVGEQQRVEILKQLQRNARILILDEPTAVLTPQESDQLFRTVRQMADEGRAVILVSHKLHEIKQVSDRVTVLRHGRRVGEPVATADATPRELAAMMVGHDLVLPTRDPNEHLGDVVLSIQDLRVRNDRGLEAVRGVSLDVRRGEIVGIAGVAGNGQRELAYAIAGLRRPVAGAIALDGVDITGTSVTSRIARGIGYVPQNRLGMGLAPGLTTEENLGLKAYRKPPFSRGPFLVPKTFKDVGAQLIDEYDIRGVRPGLPIRLLSGGNLQKALIAREVTQQHSVLVARSPTRGLDVGATGAVRNLLLRERDGGVGVLLISEDLDELLALSDRLLVLFEGRIVGELTSDEADPARLGLLMAGHVEETA